MIASSVHMEAGQRRGEVEVTDRATALVSRNTEAVYSTDSGGDRFFAIRGLADCRAGHQSTNQDPRCGHNERGHPRERGRRPFRASVLSCVVRWDARRPDAVGARQERCPRPIDPRGDTWTRPRWAAPEVRIETRLIRGKCRLVPGFRRRVLRDALAVVHAT